MLSVYPSSRPDGSTLAGAAWVDLFEPTEAEQSRVAEAFSLRVPAQAELAEIETTSRLQIDKDTFYLTAPLIYAADSEPWLLAPTGFVLSKKVLLTVRFAKSVPFDAVAKELSGEERFEPPLAFVCLLEELVDRMADLLETSSHDLDEASHMIFSPNRRLERRLSRETVLLRRLMIRTGRTSERMTRIHYALVCLDRMAKFTVERGRDWIAPDLLNRLHGISSDAGSLIQYADALVNRVQLLQDAATGIINIDQNEVMKVLTVASVVGIPPVLIVGIYGMNFKHMPELDWTWGYPFALALVVITALLPLIWFRLKDWI